ncbi:hypothetical protein Trydic_g19067 [Trypoxylus dichotomus]
MSSGRVNLLTWERTSFTNPAFTELIILVIPNHQTVMSRGAVLLELSSLENGKWYILLHEYAEYGKRDIRENTVHESTPPSCGDVSTVETSRNFRVHRKMVGIARRRCASIQSAEYKNAILTTTLWEIFNGTKHQ